MHLILLTDSWGNGVIGMFITTEAEISTLELF